MRTVTLFIAMSLDGYIAGADGSVDWLEGQSRGQDDMQSYEKFIKNIDTVIMGFRTYNQISTELSPDEWPYRNLKSYVVTHRENLAKESVTFTHENAAGLVNRLKSAQGKGIWICGGADTACQLIRENLIDVYHLSIIPVILGKGIPLFGTDSPEIKLKLIRSESYNGITDLIYERRNNELH